MGRILSVPISSFDNIRSANLAQCLVGVIKVKGQINTKIYDRKKSFRGRRYIAVNFNFKFF